MKDLIDSAYTIGQKRKPITHSIYVHVDFNWNGNNAYLEAIKESTKKSENSVFLHFKGSKFEKVDGIHTIYNEGHTGYLSYESLEEFVKKLEGINPNDSFTIHGANFGMCPTNFAVQLGVLLYGQENYLKIIESIPSDFESIIFSEMEQRQQITLGIVNDAHDYFKKALEYQEVVGKFPMGFIVTQMLMTDQTKVFSPIERFKDN